MINLPEEFKKYLLSQSKKASPLTVKNYSADVNQFISWYENKFKEDFSAEDVSIQTVENFRQDLNLSASSVERHISSLRKFFIFLKLEGYISHSPFEQLTASAETQAEADPWRLKDFKNYLYVYNSSHLTIKNYIIDIKQFLSWLTEVTSLDSAQKWIVEDRDLFSKITPHALEEYKKRLVEKSDFSPASINRKLSSIRKFVAWAKEEGLLRQEAEISNIKSQIPNIKDVEAQQSSNEAIQQYSGFAPFRLIQKLTNVGVFVFDELFVTPLSRALGFSEHLFWIVRGRPVFDTDHKLNLKSKIFGLQDTKSKILNTRKISNISKSFYAPAQVSVKYFPFHRKVWHHLRYTRPNWYTRYHQNPLSSYLHFAIILVFMTVAGLTLYNNFAAKPPEGQILAAPPTAPLRVLSFQGRLTDNSDNPITTATWLRFIIYNNSTSSGSARLWEEVRSVTPDSDGIFSVLLGSDGSGGAASTCNGQSPPASPATGACGIMSSLFQDNNALWLGATVNQTPELTPRQQIATVAYASNAETLQGLEPITNSAATSNVVLALNSSGNLAIGGSATPIFQATGGSFTIQGTTTTVSSTTGSGGNVILAPDGLGKIELQKPVQNSTLNNNITSAAGSVEIDDMLAVLATSSGQSAVTINQDSTGPLISASTSGVAKFTVDNSGNVTLAGDLTITGNDITNTTLNLGNGSAATLGTISNDALSIIPNGTGALNLATTNTGAVSIGNGTGTITLTASGITANTNSVLYSGSSNVLGTATTATQNLCILSAANTPAWGNCIAGTNIDVFWNQSSGALYPNNSTVDLLIGG